MGLFSDKEQDLVHLSDIKVSEEDLIRVSTTIPPLDRALGGLTPAGTGIGGFVKGSVILLGGEPGSGKSTLLIQLLDAMAKAGHRCVYDSAEESATQLKMMAQRCLVTSDIYIGNISVVEDLAQKVIDKQANMLVVDSIQGFSSIECDKRPGSITQLEVACDSMIKFAKDTKIPLVIICQLTGDGGFKGPRTLEHNVDVVGKLTHGKNPDTSRILTFSKNRFGPTLIPNEFPWLHDLGRYDFTPAGLATLEGPTPVRVEDQTEVIPMKRNKRLRIPGIKSPEGPMIEESVLVELAALKYVDYAHRSPQLLYETMKAVGNLKQQSYQVHEEDGPKFGLSVKEMRSFMVLVSETWGATLESRDPYTIRI